MQGGLNCNVRGGLRAQISSPRRAFRLSIIVNTQSTNETSVRVVKTTMGV